ncbi:MAG: 4'-phosphopantetheinyl transferase superfamily protein [Leptospiraceae bacterium]|nr:4'-phosphopantetheinyl transferase superfamily protein [Leptospiraceae bacterium]MDW7975369.1 4'-phosphopantetheinyl transferase superfamily protein [Leptospiraceae bacterium]
MNIFLPLDEVWFGNDIVDLEDPDTSLDHLNQRFIQKIGTPNEIEHFFSTLEPLHEKLILLWTIWALKESAYKAISRTLNLHSFRYKDYEVLPNMEVTKYQNLFLKNYIYLDKKKTF